MSDDVKIPDPLPETYNELKSLAAKLDLDTSGNTEALRERIQAHQRKPSQPTPAVPDAREQQPPASTDEKTKSVRLAHDVKIGGKYYRRGQEAPVPLSMLKMMPTVDLAHPANQQALERRRLEDQMRLERSRRTRPGNRIAEHFGDGSVPRRQRGTTSV